MKGRVFYLLSTVATAALSAASLAGTTPPPTFEIIRPAQTYSSYGYRRASLQASTDVMIAQQKLNVVRSRLAKALETDPELVAAQQNAIDARRVFAAVRKTTVSKLGNDSAYIAALFELEKREQRLSAVRDGGGGFPQITQEAKSVMEARSTVRAIEQATYKDDLNFDSARQAMIDANARIAQLKMDTQSRIVSDPDFQAARDQLTAARQALRQ